MDFGKILVVDKSNGSVFHIFGEIYGASSRPSVDDLVLLELQPHQNDDEFSRLKDGLNSIKIKNLETKELEFELINKNETEEEKLRREKIELENQLLLQEDNKIQGGLL